MTLRAIRFDISRSPKEHSESRSIREAHRWIVSISTGPENALFAEVPLAQLDAK